MREGVEAAAARRAAWADALRSALQSDRDCPQAQTLQGWAELHRGRRAVLPLGALGSEADLREGLRAAALDRRKSQDFGHYAGVELGGCGSFGSAECRVTD